MVRKKILLSLFLISYSGIIYAHTLHIRNETNDPINVQPWAIFSGMMGGQVVFGVSGKVQARTYQLPSSMPHNTWVDFHSDDPQLYWAEGRSTYHLPSGPGGCFEKVELVDNTNKKSLTVPFSVCHETWRTVGRDNNGNLTFR